MHVCVCMRVCVCVCVNSVNSSSFQNIDVIGGRNLSKLLYAPGSFTQGKGEYGIEVPKADSTTKILLLISDYH